MRRAVLGLVLAVAASVPAALSADDRVEAAQPDPTEPLVVARVGETPIFRAAFNAAVARTAADKAPSDAQKLRARAEVISQLIDEQLLRRIIKREGAEATDAEIDAFVSQIQTQLAPSKIPFETFLARTGRDEKTLRSHVALEIGINKLMTPRLTPEAVRAAYEERRKELDGTQVRVSHIVLRPNAAGDDAATEAMLAKATAIRSEIVQGEKTFAEAAKQYSAGPSRRRGGDLGYIARHTSLSEEFASQAFSLRKGDVSKPFVTPSGVHVTIVTDVRNGTIGFDRLRPQIEKLLAQKLLRDLLSAERAGTPIVYAPGTAHLEPDPTNPTGPAKVVVEPLPVGQ